MKTSYSRQESSSEVVTPTGRKSLRSMMAERDGKGLARVQKEKNGTITKDDVVLFEKEASFISPEVLYFFRDELEKQGVSPRFALKHMDSPGLQGTVARGYSKMFSPSGILNPKRINRLNQASEMAIRPDILSMGPEFTAATVKGLAKAEAAKSLIPAVKENPYLADIATFYEQNVPSHLFGEGYQRLTDRLGPLKSIVGL